MTIPLVEPVTRILTMEFDGVEHEMPQPFATLPAARSDGLHAACMKGTIRVVIVGADGTELCRYERSENRWHDHLRGKLTVTTAKRSCTCGWRPTVAVNKPYQFQKAMGGWFWCCKRCGASLFSLCEPRGDERRG